MGYRLRRRKPFCYPNLYAYPAGADFCSCKSQQNTLGALPQDPDAPERPPGKPKGGFPDRGLNGAYKVSQMHLPPPGLPRFGGGERPPFLCKPPAPLTITMGQRLVVFASPNTPRALLSVYSCQPIRAPFPPRERGWGERADALRLPWERFCAQYGLIFGSHRKSIRIQHSQRQGSWGSAPSVFWFLLHE